MNDLKLSSATNTIRAATARRIRLSDQLSRDHRAALEAFALAGANLSPNIMRALAKKLFPNEIYDPANDIIYSPARPSVCSPPEKNSPEKKKITMLNGKSLKVVVPLNPAEISLFVPPATARVMLDIQVFEGPKVRADIATKSLRKAQATIVEYGFEEVAVFIQGKLRADNVVCEAGLVAQQKLKKGS